MTTTPTTSDPYKDVFGIDSRQQYPAPNRLKMYLEAAAFHLGNEKYADVKGCIASALKIVAEQPSPARSDKDAERVKPWPQINAESIAAQDLLDWNRSQSTRYIEVTKELGVARKAFEFLAAAHEIVAAQVAFGKAQESAPSGESIATWGARQRASRYERNAEVCMLDEIADLRAALARRATAGNAAPTEAGITASGERDSALRAEPAWRKTQKPCTVCGGQNYQCAHCDGMGIEPRKIDNYGECKCVLSRYCDGKCNPVFASSELASNAAPTDVCAEMRALCSACGGTGDVVSIDGEWRGSCDCAASNAATAAPGDLPPPAINTGNCFPDYALGADQPYYSAEQVRSILASNAGAATWTDLKHEKPKDWQQVLVALNNGEVVMGMRGSVGWHWCETDDPATAEATATHWQPWPAAPSNPPAGATQEQTK